MTDSKSVTRFFQTETIPPPLWIAWEFVLQFKFTSAHIPRKLNNAAEFLSRLEKGPNEKMITKIREDIPTKSIEVNIESTGNAQKSRSSLRPQINRRLHKKNFGNLKKKHEMPNQTIHQSLQYRVITQTNYTKTQKM